MAGRDSQDIPRRILDLDGQDAYAVLDVRSDATPDEIKAAYRRELARAHPDLGGSDHHAQLVNCAFDVLTRHRDDYDGLREATVSATGPEVLWVEPDADPLDDLFDDLLDDPGRTWWAGRGVLLAVAAGLVTVIALALGGVGRAPSASPGWTAGEVGEAGEAGELGDSPATSGDSPAMTVVSPAETARSPVTVGSPTGEVPAAASWSVPATDVVMVASASAAGGGHRCEVRGDGSLWCAGSNARGQLGDGTHQDAVAPVRVAGTPGARWGSVSVGGGSTCGLQEDGTLWCWGDNSHGQLGDGTDSARAFPVAIDAGSRWLTVDVDTHTCAVRADRTLWCWGAGGSGELGRDRRVDQASPVRVGFETGWVSVSTEPGRTCATRRDGSQRCWGTGRNGTPTR